MTVKIVTDSTSDLPQALADQLGITIVPLYVLFGNQTYRDRVDISEAEFYERLTNSPVHPTTSQPSPQDFIDVYQRLSKNAEGIISIHISSKLSGTCNSAIQAKEKMPASCPIEVIDSESVSMGLGLVAIAAARLAKEGARLPQLVAATKTFTRNIYVWALFDTLKYLALGGRIGKAQALMGSLLNIKPLLAVKTGEMVPVTKARNREKGLDLICGFIDKLKNIEDLSVMYTTAEDEALALADRFGSVIERKHIIPARLGPALGVHAGPGTLGVAVRCRPD